MARTPWYRPGQDTMIKPWPGHQETGMARTPRDRHGQGSLITLIRAYASRALAHLNQDSTQKVLETLDLGYWILDTGHTVSCLVVNRPGVVGAVLHSVWLVSHYFTIPKSIKCSLALRIQTSKLQLTQNVTSGLPFVLQNPRKLFFLLNLLWPSN